MVVSLCVVHGMCRGRVLIAEKVDSCMTSAACWVCDGPVNATCRFCGRMVCKDHASKLPFTYTIYVGANSTPKALIVADAIWCGICRPLNEPVELPELY